jgi:hypothetical protein
VRFGLWITDLVDPIDDGRQSGIEPDQAGNLAERSLQAALGARAIVPNSPAFSMLLISRPIWSSA